MNDVAVVCGAGGSLGLAVLGALAAPDRMVVAVASPRQDRAELSSSQPGFHWEQADLADPNQVDQLWSRIDGLGGRLRWLVNVAGGFRSGTVLDTTPQDLRYLLQVNLATAWWACRAAAWRMRKSGGGAIVNVGSRSALVAQPGAAAYSVSKGAVVKLTEVLAEELKGSGVRVNAVLPAVIDTPANRIWMREEELRRAVAPERIAQVIAFLCSDHADAISGAAIPVYGEF